MASFLYFLPGVRSTSIAVLREGTLRHAFDADGFSQCHCSRGPGGADGLVIGYNGAQPIGYHPDVQAWLPMRGAAAPAWLGTTNGQPPKPGDLLRTDGTRVGVYTAPLGDGNRWLVPTAILADGESPLPKTRAFDAEGKIVRRVVKDLEPLMLAADEIKSAIAHGEPVTTEREVAICLLALQANYRVGLDEAMALDLLTDQGVQYICWLLVDRLNWDDIPAAEQPPEKE